MSLYAHLIAKLPARRCIKRKLSDSLDLHVSVPSIYDCGVVAAGGGKGELLKLRKIEYC